MSGIPVTKMLTIGILPSFLKVWYYRIFCGARVGKRVKLGLLSVIDSPRIELGDDCKIGLLSFVRAKERFCLGDRSVLGSMVAIDTGTISIDCDSKIMEQVVVGGMLTPRSRLSIGKRVKIFPYCFINPTEEIIIEDDVGVGGANYIFTHGTWPNMMAGFPGGFGPVKIRTGVWLPWRVFIMPNVEIGEHSIIGAGSVVNKSVPERALAAGAPAKVLKTDGSFIRRMTDERKEELFSKIRSEFIEYLSYLGWDVKETQHSSGLSVVEAKGSADFSFIFDSSLDDSQLSNLPDSSILISLFRSRDDIINSSSIHSWFSLNDKVATLKRDEGWTLIKDFLSRYGIRFDYIY